MLIEITQEEYKMLQKIKLKNELFLRAVLEAGELNYYKEADSLDYGSTEINSALRLIYPEEFRERVEDLLKEEERKKDE